MPAAHVEVLVNSQVNVKLVARKLVPVKSVRVRQR